MCPIGAERWYLGHNATKILHSSEKKHTPSPFAMEHRKSTVEEWMDTRRPPEERLVKFEAWLRKQMVARLEWPSNAALRQRQVGQCQRFVAGFLCDLHSR